MDESSLEVSTGWRNSSTKTFLNTFIFTQTVFLARFNCYKMKFNGNSEKNEPEIREHSIISADGL